MNKEKIKKLKLKMTSNWKTFSGSYKNINEMVNTTISRLNVIGEKQNTRNGAAICLYDQEVVMLNPLARHLHLQGRTNNIFGTIGEMFWVMAGEKNIRPVLEFFVPRAPLYSDDDKTWHASYGDRLWNYKQIDHAVKMFQVDGLLTRRSTSSIYIPELDAYENYMKAEGTMKDVPCNQWINYYVQRFDNSYLFNMKVNARSNDIIFGLGNINIPEFTLIQEMMFSIVKELYSNENIELGVYKHNATNLHVYDALEKQFKNILDGSEYNENVAIPKGSDYLEAKFPNVLNKETGELDVYIIQRFFSEIVKLFAECITNLETDLTVGIDYGIFTVNEIFKKYGVERENNSLYAYAVLCLYYIFGKRNRNIVMDFYQATRIEDYKLVEGLPMAIFNSGFRNFELTL